MNPDTVNPDTAARDWAGPRVVVAHPGADLYGSDLQLLETIRGMTARGWDVVTVLPSDGPLVSRLRDAGSQVRIAPFPVLRKSVLRPTALARFLTDSAVAIGRIRRLLRAAHADCVLVNTMTIPVWIAGARLAHMRTVVHAHEAERDLPRPVQTVLAAPLLGATVVIANSQSTRTFLATALPALRSRITVIHNGVAPPRAVTSPQGRSVSHRTTTVDGSVAPSRPGSRRDAGESGASGSRSEAGPVLACVGRLSQRKGTDVALEATALLRQRGVPARLLVAGSVFPGYEWFEDRLRARAGEPDLAGAVDFLGYADPWDVLDGCDVVLAPSHGESFGNAAAQALLAERPLVASDVQGLAEIVRDGETGVLVPAGDAVALADGIERVLADPQWSAVLAKAGREDVAERFGIQRYREAMCQALIPSS